MNSLPIPKLNKDHIRRQFDRSAYRYDGVAQMQADIVADLLAFSVPFTAQVPASIVDVGCTQAEQGKTNETQHAVFCAGI